MEFETLSSEELADLLRQFYASVRTAYGKEYSRSAYTGFRAAIQRHLVEPPFNRKLNIIQDREFITANLVSQQHVCMQKYIFF